MYHLSESIDIRSCYSQAEFLNKETIMIKVLRLKISQENFDNSQFSRHNSNSKH